MRLVIGRYLNLKWMLFFLGILTILFASSGQAHCQSNEQIIQWVATQMVITKTFPMPAIQFIDKQGLNQLFTAGSQRYMARWTADHGSSEADKLKGVYLDKAVGLFDPVGCFLPSCQREAILAHEITHYFQYMSGGAIVGEGIAAEMMLMEREIEASAMENRFEKEFCETPGLALRP
ncbi:MAG: hypothetical protein HZB24_04845 [Desulfobacterales bacterium]|nr:hypothetical protein [Desulfobacterales bacterium]